ncbi:taste receptor type 2 member 39-like [Hyla sarda]|uniref:taste receptor type 2 member 39-like n=1 Tax=Hyla sarda TaxID=327740 RepID=UPI0024C314DD|nr:taste receptor type 2 member 39-like [Hyla sarda]
MDTITLVLLSVLYTECIAGVIINLIIVAANLMKWKTMKSLHIGDKILSSLATSRSLYLFIIFIFHLSILLDLWKNTFLAESIIVIVTMVLHSSNLWFATVLCVFYCVKITSYNWKFFIFLKTKISTLAPWFLLASLLISISSSLPLVWHFYEIQIQNLANISITNMTLSRYVEDDNIHIRFILFLIISCPPFLVFLAADCLLLHSLWMHTRRMRSSGSGFRSPNLESHFSAVKSISFFLVLQVIYFCTTVYSFRAGYTSIIESFIKLIVICSAPFLHSLYIIDSNSELKKTCISMFYSISCCVQRWKL